MALVPAASAADPAPLAAAVLDLAADATGAGDDGQDHGKSKPLAPQDLVLDGLADVVADVVAAPLMPGPVPDAQPPPVPDRTTGLPIEVGRVYILGQEVDPGLDDSVRTTGGEHATQSLEDRASGFGSPPPAPKSGGSASTNATPGVGPMAPEVEAFRPTLMQDGMEYDQPLVAWSPVPPAPRLAEDAPGPSGGDAPATPAWSAAAPAPAEHLPAAVVIASVVSGGVSLLVLVRWLAPSLSLLTRTPSREGAHPVRATLLQLVEGNPGILLSTLRQSVRCSAGTIQYHLNVLERQGAIRCVRDRQRCCVFPANTPNLERDALAALVRGRARDLAQTVLLNPGLQQKQLTGGLAMSRKTARRHLDDLVALGLVHETADGRNRTYLPSPRLGAILAQA